MAVSKQALIERLFAEHGGALRDFLRWRVRAEAEVAELFQEVYLRMLGITDVEVIRNPRAYLLSVAGNLVRERAVLARRERGHVDVEDPTVQDELSSEAPSAGGEIDAERRIQRLREVLDQLSPKCRAAVVLRYWHEWSYEQIGERLGISTNMVKKYLSQALVHCRCRMRRLR
jgi:RNA polymerase sigma-70 factor (ECF subfamily)